MSFDLRRSVALATQPGLGVLGQELQEARGQRLRSLAGNIWTRPRRRPPTILQRDWASSENLAEYSSSTSLTSFSTSSRLIFFFLCWKGDCPSTISYSRQPSAHQSGLNV